MVSGIIAEFETPEALEKAYDALRAQGYQLLATWTPYPIKKLVTKLPESVVPWIILVAGLLGGGFGYLLQWWVNLRAFQIDVGGRPLHSAPAFIPITFESAVLAASIAGFISMLWFSRLPRLHHPVFEVPGFESASIDRFWLGVDDADPHFDGKVADELARLGALRCERLGDRS